MVKPLSRGFSLPIKKPACRGCRGGFSTTGETWPVTTSGDTAAVSDVNRLDEFVAGLSRLSSPTSGRGAFRFEVIGNFA